MYGSCACFRGGNLAFTAPTHCSLYRTPKLKSRRCCLDNPTTRRMSRLICMDGQRKKQTSACMKSHLSAPSSSESSSNVMTRLISVDVASSLHVNAQLVRDMFYVSGINKSFFFPFTPWCGKCRRHAARSRRCNSGRQLCVVTCVCVLCVCYAQSSSAFCFANLDIK